MTRSNDRVLTVQVLAEDPHGRLVRATDTRAPKVGAEVLCVGADGRCVAAPGVVVQRLDDFTFKIDTRSSPARVSQ